MIARSLTQPRQGIGCAALLGACTVAAACGLASPAVATPRQAANGGQCPARYLVHGAGKFNAEEIQDARDYHFRVHRRKIHLQPPVNWKRDPYDSRRFRGALAGLGWLDVLFYDFRRNGRRQSLRQARDLALDWIASNPPGDGATDRSWDDRISATRATYLAYALRASGCRGLLNKRKQRRLSRAVAYHGRLSASAKQYRPTNHGLYVDANLILLARSVPGIARGKEWGRIAKRRFGRTLRGRLIESEGFWLEHSSFYQLAIRKELAFFREIATGDAFAPLLNRMTDAAGWLVGPDNRIVLLGSSNNTRAEEAVKREASDDDGLAWLGRSGLAFVKRPGAYLAAVATFFNGSHKHSDDLSFDLFDHGRRIITDSGEFDKDEGRWGRFATSAAAHSTLTVDGNGFSQRSRDAYGTGLVARGSGDGWFAILGKNPLLGRQGVGHERLFLHNPGLGLLVADRVRSKHRHTYRRYFQFGTNLAAQRSGGGVDLSDGGWSGRLDDATRRGDPGLALARGKRQPRILGFEFPEFRKRLPRWTATLRTAGSDLDHLAVLGVAPAHSLEAKLVRLGGKRTKVELEVAGAPAGTLEVVRHRKRLDVRVVP